MLTRILIVEDDIELLNSLEELLQTEGYITVKAKNGSEALKKIEEGNFGLVLLDLGLPDISGESVLAHVRKYYPDLHVVILTAKSDPTDVAKGLNLGADDYLAKPFAVEELLARIKARIRKEGQDQKKVKIHDLEVDYELKEVRRAGKEIVLSKTEFDLLEYMLANRGRVLTREEILNHVWSYSPEVESRVVDVYIGYLRKKIDKGSTKKLIQNKYGFGYILKE